MTFKDISRQFVYESGQPTLLGKIALVIIIIIVARLVVSMINAMINRAIKKHSEDYGMRAMTLTRLTQKLIKYVIYFIAITMLLDLWSINTSAILATAGLGSLALGMGAQSLIKDCITGFFIIFDNQFSAGEFVNIAGIEGHVEEVGVRMTKLRSLDGRLHYIPNSEISIITNCNRGPVRARVDIEVDRSEDPLRVLEIINEAIGDLRESYSYGDGTLDGPKIMGITENSERGYRITVVGKRPVDYYYDLEMDIRQAIVSAFIEHDIKLPEMHYRRGEGDEKTLL